MKGRFGFAALLARFAGLIVLALCGGASGSAVAHEVRPAYLQLTEASSGLFDVLFKTPMVGDLRLSLGVGLPVSVKAVSPVLSRKTEDALVQTWRVRAPDGLAGQRLRILGLENTVSDALVRVDFANGQSFTRRVTPASSEAAVPVALTTSGVASTYLQLGVEHILTGFDHLLFVLGLILLTRTTAQLLGAVTAFTAAHSITLAAAALGFVHVPPKPLEAVIALSIVFVAVEVIQSRNGRSTLTVRMPWLAAFGFGLLHGLGFAGALSETGLPDGHIPVALFFFNVGVEVGQLLFVAGVLGLAWIVRRLWQVPNWASLVPPYLIGTMAMFWLFQRVAAF